MQLKMKKKKKKRIPIHVKPEALVSCSETSVSIVIFFTTTEQNACTPGWLNLGESCFRIYSSYQTWKYAMFKCHNLGGRRAVLGNAVQRHALSGFIDDPWLYSDHLWPCHWYLSYACSFICETDERKSFVTVK